MAGAVNHAKLDSKTAREKLKRGRQPHWHPLVVPGKRVHLGYQCWKGDEDGRWVLRRYIGSHKNPNGKIVAKYRSETLGRADDVRKADGVDVLSFEQAEANARAIVGAPTGDRVVNLTVRQAMERYTEYKRTKGQPTDDLLNRTRVHILPALGDLAVTKLDAKKLRGWLATMAATPAQTRSKNGKPRYKAEPITKEDKRRRRASANRVLTMLKAALNHAFDEGHVNNRDAWGRRLEPFEKVEVARVRYFTIDEAERLLNASTEEFRPLLRAGLETGCRYGELTRLEVQDFNPDVGTVSIRDSKTGEPRHVTLTEQGADFFRVHCAGRAGSELMFRHDDGSAWKKSEQSRPMREACEHARIKPAVGFHTTRHTWASLSVMAGVPLLVVAKNLGHNDTRMVEKHYGHLAKSFITEAIRAGAPVYGVKVSNQVVPLKR
jgi:integrase